MPGVLAHWVVAGRVANSLLSENNKLAELFRASPPVNPGGEPKKPQTNLVGLSQYYLLGAVFPDMPYHHNTIPPFFLDGLGKSNYADLMHYNKTNELVMYLAGRKTGVSKESHARTIAYALGHLTHIVTDTIMHPYVNCFAGAYPTQRIDRLHTIVELHQDSALAQSQLGLESIGKGRSWADYIPEVKDPQAEEFLEELVLALEETYQLKNRSEIYKYMVTAWGSFSNIVLGMAYAKAVNPDSASGQLLIDLLPCLYVVGLNPVGLTLKGVLKLAGAKLIADYAAKYGWDKVKDMIPPDVVNPALFNHKYSTSNYEDLLVTKAVPAAIKACKALLKFHESKHKDSDRNEFRSEVRNCNLDTGYWIDVGLEGKTLKITWRQQVS